MDVPTLMIQLGFAQDGEIERHLRATLDRFHDLGLVEPSRP